jgi:biopolymer transport protein TolR
VRRDYQIKRMEGRTRARARIRGVNLIPLLDIFTILLLFFLVQTGDPSETLPVLEQLRLPFSQAQQPPHRDLLVAIDAENVLLEGRPVARVADVAAAEADLIPGLSQALEDYLREARAAATGPEGETTARLRGAVTIMGDRAIPFTVLRKVMYTCASRHFGHISLAVQPPEGPPEG